jgi:SH3-like domain-containing protein
VALRDDNSERARPVAMVEAGVIANLATCDGRWCQVSIDKFRGYIEQKKLWGIYEGEVLK